MNRWLGPWLLSLTSVASAGCLIDFDAPFAEGSSVEAGLPDVVDDHGGYVEADAPQDAGPFVVEQTVPQLDLGAEMVALFESLPAAAGDITVLVTLAGDYKADDEYAEVLIDGSSRGFHQGALEDCDGTGADQTYLQPAAAVADGVLEVIVKPQDNVAVCDDPTLSWARVRVSYVVL